MKLVKIIIALIIVLVIGFIIFMAVNLLGAKDIEYNEKNSEEQSENEENSDEKTDIDEKIELDVEYEDEETANIIIDISEELKISKIILPDESETEEIISEYRVTQNGTYEFVFGYMNGEDEKEIKKKIKVSDLEEKEDDEKEPTYIPDGFEYKEGTVETGYVISDDYGNEFVWVPVESGILTRKNASKSKYKDTDTAAKALVNSVAKYYGFYIARYESSKADFDGNIVSTSFPNQVPWYNASFAEAFENSENFCNAFGYEDVRSALCSSYAWDTTLNWLNRSERNYSTSLEYGNYTDELQLTGETPKDIINNICDMAGNLKEWTTEIATETPSSTEDDKDKKKDEENTTVRVIRGGCVGLKKAASSQISFSEEATDNYWGFRMVIYK